ncbi:hypothetical protein KP509_21G070500 [Ceratopteris richardii]|uniref:Glutaredoxin-dependent peroxiredoxin n=1 Tax=Ceratopteris richardii TaxID=49495 RepID=A0A8T2SE95_CERRI|nr:hypothetical protein KP509_21G070500 [Ceratopteris richardii]
MAPIAVGDTLPDGTLSHFDSNDALQHVSIHSLAAGKKVTIIGVPGASTPTCNLKHVPGFIDLASEFRNKGIDQFICIIVNDPFVVKAWGKTYPNNDSVLLLADGSAKDTHALGWELDLSEKGLGIRSRRFSLLVDDLVVKVAHIEQGGEFSVSSAEDMFKAL